MSYPTVYNRYIQQLDEIQVGRSSTNYQIAKDGLKDARWKENNPWIRIGIPGGTPIRQHIEARDVQSGVLRVYDDYAIRKLFYETNVAATTFGARFLVAPKSYAADYVSFSFKATKHAKADNVDTQVIIKYDFTNFRVEDIQLGLDENYESVWEIYFNADSVIDPEFSYGTPSIAVASVEVMETSLPAAPWTSAEAAVVQAEAIAAEKMQTYEKSGTTPTISSPSLQILNFKIRGVVYGRKQNGKTIVLDNAYINIMGQTTYSNANGEYEFPTIAAYTDGVRVYLNNYVSCSNYRELRSHKWIRITGREITTKTLTIDFYLFELLSFVGSYITGHVHTGAGVNVEDAVITCYPMWEYRYVFTDSNGNFTYYYSLAFGADETPPTSQSVIVRFFKNGSYYTSTITVTLAAPNYEPTYAMGTINTGW